MIPLLIPWALLLLLLLLILSTIKQKWKFAIVLGALIVALNWWYECFPIHILPKTRNRDCLKVMAFNINGTKEDLSENASALASMIIKYSPDVLFVSEVSDNNKILLDSLLNLELPNTTYARYFWHCFYSKYPISNWRRLINMQGIKHLGVFACTIPYANDSIVFYGCHFASNNYTSDKKYVTPDSISNYNDFITYIHDVKEANIIRVKEANAVCEEVKIANHPVVFMGDLNDVCGSASIRALESAGLNDAWWKGGLGYGATINYPLPYRIDHIMYSRELKLQHIEIISSESLSDHCALYAEFVHSKGENNNDEIN